MLCVVSFVILKMSSFPSWIVLATEFDFLESRMLNLAQLWVFLSNLFTMEWAVWMLMGIVILSYWSVHGMLLCHWFLYVSCGLCFSKPQFIIYFFLCSSFFLCWCLSLSGQAKLGIHMIRLSQISAGSGSSDDLKSPTLVALLRLLESRVAFHNVFLRHHLFCILQVLSGRLVDWHLFLF